MFFKSLQCGTQECSCVCFSQACHWFGFSIKTCLSKRREIVRLLHACNKLCKKFNPHRFATLQNCSWAYVANDSLPWQSCTHIKISIIMTMRLMTPCFPPIKTISHPQMDAVCFFLKGQQVGVSTSPSFLLSLKFRLGGRSLNWAPGSSWGPSKYRRRGYALVPGLTDGHEPHPNGQEPPNPAHTFLRVNPLNLPH